MKIKFPQFFVLLIVLSSILSFLLSLVFQQFSGSQNQKIVTIEEKQYVDGFELKSLVEQVLPSVILIGKGGGDGEILGSGFVRSENEFTTALHLFDDLDANYEVILVNEEVSAAGNRFIVYIDSFDENRDLAVLRFADIGDNLEKAKLTSLKPLKSSKADDVVLGEFVFTIGYDGKYPNYLDYGIVSGLHRSGDFEKNSFGEKITLNNLIELNFDLNHGMSGAPVINLNGEVVGLINGVDRVSAKAFATEF